LLKFPNIAAGIVLPPPPLPDKTVTEPVADNSKHRCRNGVTLPNTTVTRLRARRSRWDAHPTMHLPRP
jgi:hypothetical protein